MVGFYPEFKTTACLAPIVSIDGVDGHQNTLAARVENTTPQKQKGNVVDQEKTTDKIAKHTTTRTTRTTGTTGTTATRTATTPGHPATKRIQTTSGTRCQNH